MKTRDLARLGIPRGGKAMKAAKKGLKKASAAGLGKRRVVELAAAVAGWPEKHLQDEIFGELAEVLWKTEKERAEYAEREDHAPYVIFGRDLDQGALDQMRNASRLPVAVAGALMPDAHIGYGLPIGGVLAVKNAVIPYAVGVDIACRMRLSILDLAAAELDKRRERFVRAIQEETRFGVGAKFKEKKRHPVMDQDWDFSTVLRNNKDKAWGQLGTSGSGNHFVEFGTLELFEADLGLEAGIYLALLSHSGSRGAGALTADYYSRLARDLRPGLPRELAHLAWLDLDRDQGREYWRAMRLMGDYAAANHELIHKNVLANLGAVPLAVVENHHNFAWKEQYKGREVVVHRKGATPAGKGVLGVIPGSMASPGYVVRGKGNEKSLESASHGAGRLMSRKQAKKVFTWAQVEKKLRRAGVSLLTAGLDEAPMAYKDIDLVMEFQSELVEKLARFEPKLVKMAPAGERPED